MDKTTCSVLGEGSEKYLDSESNLKIEHKISKMAFCIWGNLSKNPRCFNSVGMCGIVRLQTQTFPLTCVKFPRNCEVIWKLLYGGVIIYCM